MGLVRTEAATIYYFEVRVLFSARLGVTLLGTYYEKEQYKYERQDELQENHKLWNRYTAEVRVERTHILK